MMPLKLMRATEGEKQRQIEYPEKDSNHTNLLERPSDTRNEM